MTDFTTAFKSTIDKVGYDLATAEGVSFVDMDDISKSEALLSSSRNALVWEFLSIGPSPVDPLYSFAFRIGARTVSDSANYNILRLVDSIREVFPERTKHDIQDFSGASAGPVVGYMYTTGIVVDPQMYDKASGIRYALVTGKAVRSG